MLKQIPKETRKKIMISLSLIVALILVITGASYAVFRFVGNGNAINQITTAEISMDYKEGSNVISLHNALPTTDATGKKRLVEGEYFDFSITTRIPANTMINWEIAAEDFSDNTFDGANVKYYLTKIVDGNEVPVSEDLPKVYSEETSINKYTGRPANMMSLLVGTTSTVGVETTNYRLRLYVSEEYNPQGDGGGLTYKTRINVYGSDTIYHQITADNEVTIEKDATAGKTIHFEVAEKEGYNYNGAEILNASGKVIGTIPSDKKEFVMPEEAISIRILWKAKESTLNKKFINISGNGVSQDSVTSIVTKNNTLVPSTAVKSWDVSNEGNGGIIAYVEGTENNYTLTLGGDGKIIAPIDSSELFRYYTNVTSIDLTYLDTSKTTNMDSMFYQCEQLTELIINNFDTTNVTDMSAMFQYCSSLTSLNLNNFDTSNVTTMNVMFSRCSNLTNLDINNFDTSNVTNMYCMFYKCGNLTNLDLRSFNTSKTTNMNLMFAECSSLTSIKVSSNWTTANAQTDDMFFSCGASKVTVIS